jgi:hypothetical protein
MMRVRTTINTVARINQHRRDQFFGLRLDKLSSSFP